MRGLVQHVALTAGFLLIHRAAPAQQSTPGPVTTAFRADAERLSRNLLAAADDTPPMKYQFKPTPAQMSVAEVVLHLAGDSEFGCAALGGAKAPAEPKLTPADSVPKLVARLTRAFAFCRTQLAKLNDAGLGDKISGYDGPTTRAAMIFELHEDWADHYSQLANYLRLNGILPPTARRAN
jgi:DinB superfamily